MQEAGSDAAAQLDAQSYSPGDLAPREPKHPAFPSRCFSLALRTRSAGAAATLPQLFQGL